jgi:hypothetical protein
LLATGACAQDDPWVFVHPKATFIAGVGWQSVKNSEFAQILRRDMAGKTASLGDMDFVDRLDFALLSVPDLAGGQASGARSMLVVLRGKFDLVRLHAMAGKEGAKTQTYNDVELLSPPKDETAVVAIVDPTTLLVGDRPSVTLAIRGRFRSGGNSELVQRALAVSEKSNAWMVFDAPSDIGNAAPMLQGLKRMALAINLHRNADLTIELEAQDPQHAGAFAAATQMLISTQKVRMGALKVEAEGNSVRMSTSITPEQARAGVQQFGANVARSFDAGGLGGLLGPQRKAAPAAATPPLEPPLPPEKNVIRIYGLEGGVREIPVNPN